MLAYLWHRDQAELLKEMIDCKIHAIILKVAALGKCMCFVIMPVSFIPWDELNFIF